MFANLCFLVCISLFHTGEGRSTEAANDSVKRNTPRLQMFPEGVFIVSVACGRGHTIALSDTGRLFSWGSNKNGQLGHRLRNETTGAARVPKMIEAESVQDVVFTQIACGSKHTLALSTRGQVYSFGSGEHGQTGHGDTFDKSTPTRIEGSFARSSRSLPSRFSVCICPLRTALRRPVRACWARCPLKSLWVLSLSNPFPPLNPLRLPHFALPCVFIVGLPHLLPASARPRRLPRALLRAAQR